MSRDTSTCYAASKEAVAFELMKYIDARTHSPGPRKDEDARKHYFDLYSDCLEAVEGAEAK